MKKIIKSRIFLVILTAIIVSSVTVYAVNNWNASEIDFEPTNPNWNVSKVDKALDDLYIKISNKKIVIPKYMVNILTTNGGYGQMSQDNLEDYKTLTIGSRTRDRVVGTTYYKVLGWYKNNSGEEVEETVLSTTSTSSSKETYDISKYYKLIFIVDCTATGSSPASWVSYYFNDIEIF